LRHPTAVVEISNGGTGEKECCPSFSSCTARIRGRKGAPRSSVGEKGSCSKFLIFLESAARAGGQRIPFLSFGGSRLRQMMERDHHSFSMSEGEKKEITLRNSPSAQFGNRSSGRVEKGREKVKKKMPMHRPLMADVRRKEEKGEPPTFPPREGGRSCRIHTNKRSYGLFLTALATAGERNPLKGHGLRLMAPLNEKSLPAYRSRILILRAAESSAAGREKSRKGAAPLQGDKRRRQCIPPPANGNQRDKKEEEKLDRRSVYHRHA